MSLPESNVIMYVAMVVVGLAVENPCRFSVTWYGAVLVVVYLDEVVDQVGGRELFVAALLVCSCGFLICPEHRGDTM
eukprot:5026731-Amphidinium_carterae.1